MIDFLKIKKTVIPCLICGGSTSFLYVKNNFDVRRCSSCGLGTIHPQPLRNLLLDIYQQRYHINADQHGYHIDYEELKDGLLKTYTGFTHRLIKDLDIGKVDSVLDVGCAYGYFLDVAQKELNARNLWGIDVCKDAIDRIQNKGYHGIQSFLEDVDLPEETFDIIFVGNCFEHLFDPLTAIRKMRNALKKNGIILITTVNFASFMARILGKRWRLMTPPEHIFFWTRESLQIVFNQHNFTCKFRKYWVYAPKKYVQKRFQDQFGFNFNPIYFFPNQLIPVPAIDILMGIFKKN